MVSTGSDGVRRRALTCQVAAYLEYRYPLRLKPQPDNSIPDPVPLESILISSAASPMLNSPMVGSSAKMERRASAASIKMSEEPAVALLEPEKRSQGINLVVLTKRLAWDQIFMSVTKLSTHACDKVDSSHIILQGSDILHHFPGLHGPHGRVRPRCHQHQDHI